MIQRDQNALLINLENCYLFEGLTPQQAADAAIKLFNNYTDSCDRSSSGKEKADALIN